MCRAIGKLIRYRSNMNQFLFCHRRFKALEERIKNRGDNDLASINLRLENAKKELICASEYANMIINDSFEDASDTLYQIITQEKAIIRPNHKELEQFLAKLLSS